MYEAPCKNRHVIREMKICNDDGGGIFVWPIGIWCIIYIWYAINSIAYFDYIFGLPRSNIS